MAAMLTVLNKRWISKGWRAMDKADSEPMALVFIEALNRESVPYQHYHELYQRAVELRARRMEQGLSCDDFSVDMMLACWPGLKREIRQREIDARNLLPANAESVCQDCFGTGFKRVQDGEYFSAKPCDHGAAETAERMQVAYEAGKAGQSWR